MNNIETNALRIAKLMGTFMYNKFARLGQLMSEARGEKIRCIEYYSSYNGLMPIVFECNYKQDDLDIEIMIYSLGLDVHLNDEDILITTFDTEEEFIQAIQLACIKYLELKNEH